MPIIYSSLGLSAAAATVLTLTFRGLSFWLPLLIGFILLQRLRIFHAPERSLAQASHPYVLAWLTAAMGLLNVFSALTPALVERTTILEVLAPLEVSSGGRLTAAMAGFALLLLAFGLARRQRMAWLLTLGALFVSTVSHLMANIEYGEAILAALLACYLLWQHSHFQARSDPPTLRRGVRTILVALSVTIVYGATGFFLLARHYDVIFSLWTALRQTVVMFTQFYNPGLHPLTGLGHYFAASIYLVGIVSLGYGLWSVLRPVVLRRSATATEQARAQQIVEQNGGTALARFLLFPDKAYYFTKGGSVIGYATRGGTAIALGDPVGPSADIANAITGFHKYCQQQGWQTAFYQTLPDHLKHYQESGFEAIRIGHEAVIDLQNFTLAGKSGKEFRTVINRMTRLGHTAEIIEPPLRAELVAELRAVSDDWLALMHGKELRFSLGWFQDEYVRTSPVIVIRTEFGQVSAFANLVPAYQKNEVSVDLMRRRHEALPGTMDFLFSILLQWSKERGYATFNLGLSALSGVGEEPTDPAMEKALHYAYNHINQFYNFQGLHAFKAKFNPSWEPRYLVVPGYVSLPAVWTTLARIGTNTDFLADFRQWLMQLLKNPTGKVTMQRDMKP